MHSEEASGIGIATKYFLIVESVWLNVMILQVMFKQDMNWISYIVPPIIACPLCNGTIECPWVGCFKFGPRKVYLNYQVVLIVML